MAQRLNVLQGPEPVETAELHFKLQCRLKVFKPETKYEEGHCCILAVSQYYGLIFVGNLRGFSVISTKSLHAGVNPEEFPHRNISVNGRPRHISVDTTQKILAVVCFSKVCSSVNFYNIQSFASKDVEPFKCTWIPTLQKTTQSAEIVDLIWQPNTEASLVICLSDGSVLALPQGIKDDTVFALPSSTRATCFCWSPKGKQIVIGSANGTLSQYKPDLKLVKVLPAPPFFSGSVMVVSVLWISSFQFAVAYNHRANPESFPIITIVNTPKNGPITVVSYDDITYSSTLFRNHQIYMSHQTAWNLIFVSSANSIETAVLHSKDNLVWKQWLLGDASRAELPLNPDRQETFPLGWAFDYTSQESIPWGEGSLPPMPRLLLVSDEGLLCVFNVVNTSGDAPRLCAPPKESFDDSLFTVSENVASLDTLVATSLVQAGKGLLGSPPSFGTNTWAKPTYSFQPSHGFAGFTMKAPQDASMSLQQQPEQPKLQIQKQQQQPLVQTQQQQQLQAQVQQAPLALPTQSESSAAPVKLSFGAAPAFSVAFPSKPTTTERPQSGEPSRGSFALLPSASQKDIFSTKTLPQSTPIKQPEVHVQDKTTTPSPAAKKPEGVEPTGKTEETLAKGDNAGPSTPELTAVDDSVYLSALQEEIDHFNSELQQLSARVGNLDIQLGTEEDKARMRKSIDCMHSFWKELKETTEGQSIEIHAVVVDLMEAFAWLEDAKSRNLQRKNPTYIELKKSEELDPLNARHMNEISHLKYYIMNQLKQLTEYLGKEWMDHQQNHRNDIKNKMTVPPLEEVYKTMHYQLKILHKQKALLEELKTKTALKKRKNKSQNLISSANPVSSVSNNFTNGNRSSELSKLAENLLQLKINREEDSAQTGALELVKSQLAAISDRSKKLTRVKQTALRDALSERDMVKIRPLKTTLESSTFLRSLHLDKTAPKPPKTKPYVKHHQDHTHKQTPAPSIGVPTSQPEPKPDSLPDQNLAPVTKVDTPNNPAPVEKAVVPLSGQPLPGQEDKSPLDSLSVIVSNIYRFESEPFVFKSPNLQKTEPGKDAKSEQKQKDPKISQPFTFGVSKPAEFMFGKPEPAAFGGKPTFSLPSSISIVATKSDPTKATITPNITITPITTTPSSASSSFTFTPATTVAAGSTGLPKVNLFTGKEATSGFGAPATSESLFSVTTSAPAPATTTTATTSSSLFASSVPIFGGANKTTTTSTTTITSATSTSLFGFPKPTTDTSAPPFGVALVQTSESKSPPPEDAVHSPKKRTSSETEEVDVVGLDESTKKLDQAPENSPDSPKTSTAPAAPTTPSIFPAPAKSPLELTCTAPSNVSSVSSASAVTTANGFSKSATPAPEVTSSTETSHVVTTASVTSSATAATTTSVFSFSTVSTPVLFGQATAAATTTTTSTSTTTSFFGTPTTTTGLFGQVSSTTPTIFGGSTTVASPSANIFGGSTPVKTTPDQPSTPSTTSGNIFGPSTPTTNTFGQVSNPLSTPSTPFGQKAESIDHTANLFGQLLSDNNKSVFGGSSTPTTTTNIFSSPKSIFEPTTTAATTTAPVFGSFAFGHSRTTSNIFGQPQTSSASNFFFGQNMYGSFGKGATPASAQTPIKNTGFSEPIFGQSLFAQDFKRTPNTPSFGGSPSSTSTNFFQTPTTSTAFGSTVPVSGGTSTFGDTPFRSSTSTFQKPLGTFSSPGGSAPVPSFGGSPTFGGSPSFGSLPTFGSMPQGAFGQSAGSTTFENLASQNTVGFANLAQQTQGQGFGGGFGSSSFENKSAFGGDSFSSWRSK